MAKKILFLFYPAVSLSDLTKYTRNMVGLFHPVDSTFLKSCLQLHQAYFEAKNWRQALEFGKLALPGIE